MGHYLKATTGRRNNHRIASRTLFCLILLFASEFCLPQSDSTKSMIADFKKQSATLSAADKEKARSLFSRGFEAFKAGRNEVAITWLTEGINIDPAEYRAVSLLAQANERLGQMCDAKNWFELVVELAPPASPERVEADALLKSKRYDPYVYGVSAWNEYDTDLAQRQLNLFTKLGLRPTPVLKSYTFTRGSKKGQTAYFTYFGPFDDEQAMKAFMREQRSNGPLFEVRDQKPSFAAC